MIFKPNTNVHIPRLLALIPNIKDALSPHSTKSKGNKALKGSPNRTADHNSDLKPDPEFDQPPVIYFRHFVILNMEIDFFLLWSDRLCRSIMETEIAACRCC